MSLFRGYRFMAGNGKPLPVNAERKKLTGRRRVENLHRPVPFGFWLEKILGGCCYSFLSPVLDKLSIHTGFVISVLSCSQWVSGFVFFDPRETY
jgi:hypothetical protein